MRFTTLGLALTCAFLLCAAPSSPAQSNWPQFRGPGGQGDSTSSDLPLNWSETQNAAWKTPIDGKAWSSPVVWGKQVWITTATPDGRQLSAICLDKDNGQVVYNLKLFDVANPQFIHDFNSPASPTPTIEDGRVYVTFGSPGTACIDTATGKVLWQRTDFICNHWRGAGASPLLYKDLLILPFDGADFQYIVAMNKQTGETVWRTDRSVDYQDLGPNGKPKAGGDFRKAFSTPRLMMVDGKPQVVSLASRACYAYEPETGKEIWRMENHTAHSGSATPSFWNNLVLIEWGFERPALWAVKPGTGALDESHIAWKIDRGAGSKPSLAVVDDLAYMIADNGVLSCIDAAAGKEVWKQRLKGNYSASPLVSKGRIYFFSEDGVTTVIQPGREFKKLAENELKSGFMSCPAVSGDALILRTRTHIYRIQETPKS